MYYKSRKYLNVSIASFLILTLAGCGMYLANTTGQYVSTTGAGASKTTKIRNYNTFFRIDQISGLADVEDRNGHVLITDSGKVRNVSTDNGTIEVERGGVVSGTIQASNGKITVSSGSIQGSILSSNGPVSLSDAIVGGNIEADENVTLNRTVVNGNLVMGSASESLLIARINPFKKEYTVTIGPNSEVNGIIIANRELKLFIHESAKVNGVQGASPTRYSGDLP